MMSDEFVKVRAGIDVGNATTIAAVSVADASAVIVAMPTQKTLRGARNVAPRNRDEHILSYAVDGVMVPRYVGALAIEGEGISDAARGSRSRYADGWTADFILAALCAGAPRAIKIEAEIAVSVPAELYSDALAGEIATTLTRAYSFQYGGDPREVVISAVMVERECYAALLSLEPMPAGRILGVDIGGGTINLVDIENGALRGVKTLHNVGNEYVLDDVDTRLAEVGGRALTKLERRRLLDAMRDGGEYAITINNQPRRVDELAKLLINGRAGVMPGAVADFVSVLKSRVDVGVYDAIYLTGGAARDGLWGRKLLELLPVARRISEAPEEDNARGLLRKAGGRVPPIKRKRGRREQ